jgi:hypothetical protein
MSFTKTWESPVGPLRITEEELAQLGVPLIKAEDGEIRGELKTFGPWCIPLSFKALCLSVEWDERNDWGCARMNHVTAYGLRTLSKVKYAAFHLEGKVTLDGRAVRGFTTFQMFVLPNGLLLNIDVIHACLND